MIETFEIRNAQIESTMLGYEDHGILTCMLHTRSAGCGQGFGGFRLDMYDKKKKKAVGHAFGSAFIGAVLKTVGVEKWEDLNGKYIRVEASFCSVRRIGHITEDMWFDPKELAKEYFGDEVES